MHSKVALWWDESFLWGIVLYHALKSNALPFELINSHDILTGALDKYRLLVVPGGWASNKLRKLGRHGCEQIQDFVQKGGAYLGICGGAGAGTLDGIGLLKVKRIPTATRTPSLSGEVILSLTPHSIWQGVGKQFHIWWPSQFLIQDQKILILATYEDIGEDFYSSDLKASFVKEYSAWRHFEINYGINLNPKRIIGQPAVLMGNHAKGEVILSLVHFDTPQDPNGAKVLRNIWQRYGIEPAPLPFEPLYDCQISSFSLLDEIKAEAQGLINFALQNFLIFKRNDYIYHWRRGIRGLEYSTLLVMVNELYRLCRYYKVKNQNEILSEILAGLRQFATKAKRLLFMQRLQLQFQGQPPTPEITSLHKELFGEAKSHGGSFKNLIDAIDDILYNLLLIDNNQIATAKQ